MLLSKQTLYESLPQYTSEAMQVNKHTRSTAVVCMVIRRDLQAVWFSASGDLAFDARRDFNDIGALQYEPVELHDLRHCKVKAGGKLADASELSRGILFSTYDLLIAGKTRGPKAKTAATSGSAAMDGTSPAAPADDVDLGRLEFGD